MAGHDPRVGSAQLDHLSQEVPEEGRLNVRCDPAGAGDAELQIRFDLAVGNDDRGRVERARARAASCGFEVGDQRLEELLGAVGVVEIHPGRRGGRAFRRQAARRGGAVLLCLLLEGEPSLFDHGHFRF
jgi:hypothetical protein